MTTLQQDSENIILEEQKRAKRAFRLLLALGITITLAATVIFIRIVSIGDVSSDLSESGSGIIAGILCLMGAFLAKRNHITAAVGFVTVALFGMDLFLISRLTDVGLPLTISLTIILILIASQTLPHHHLTRGIIAIFTVGSIILLLDQFWPIERGWISEPDLRIIYIASTIIIGIGLAVVIRQFPKFSVQSKLVAVAIALVVVTVFMTTVVVNEISRRALTEELNREFETISQAQSAAISELLGRQVEVIQTLSLDGSLRNQTVLQNILHDGTDEEILQSILEFDEEWRNETDNEVSISILNNIASSTLRNFTSVFPAHSQVILTDKYGAVVGVTSKTIDYYHGDKIWWQNAFHDGEGAIYISEPEVNESIGETGITIALPVYDAHGGDLLGILSATYELTQLIELIESADDLGAETHLDMVFGSQTLEDVNGELSLEPIRMDSAAFERLRQNTGGNVIDVIEGEDSLINLSPITTFSHIPAIDALGWSVVLHQAEEEAFAPLASQQQVSIVVGLLAIVIGSILAAYFSRYLTAPINRLTQTAVLISGGDINRRAPVETSDEIGTLATAFNNMTEQLRNFIGSLEERVASRTKDLSTSSEVSRQLSTILDQDELVSEVVNQIRDSFNYYHAQIYLYDDQKEYLRLVGGTGEAGREMLAAGHKLGTNQGLVGRAAATNRVVLISDVAQDATWLSNELLPDTKSEAAIPIALGDDVLGVLDVQHNVAGGLDEESVQILRAIANQVAIALQNSRQVAQTERALAETDRLFTLAEEQASRLALLNEMSIAFNAANSQEEVYQIVSERLPTIIEGDYATIALMDASGEKFDVVVLRDGKAAISDRFSLATKGSAIWQAMYENKLIRLPIDRPMAEFSDTKTLAAEGYGSMLTVPLVVGATILGALNIISKQPKAFQDMDLNLVRQIATTLAATIEGQRISERANLLASIVENHPDFIGVGTFDGRAIYVNPSGLQMMDLPLDSDISQMEASDFYSAEDAELLTNVGIPTAMESGAWSVEAGLLRGDGSVIPVEETIGINYDAGHNPVSFSITMRDITDRKLADEAIHLSEQMALDFQEKLTRLHDISVELSQLTDLDEIYNRGIELGLQKLDFDRLGLRLFDEDFQYSLGTYGTDKKGNVRSEGHLAHYIPDNPWLVPFIESKERRFINHDHELYDDEEVVGRGWNMVAILYHEDRVIGWIAADNLLKQRPLLTYEPDLLTLYAATLANVIMNKRTETTLAKQAKDLQAVAEVSRIATSILDKGELLQRVADLTKEQFALYHVHIFLLSEDGQNLVMTKGSGDVGKQLAAQGLRIPVRQERSLVARAARTRQSIVINDVEAEPGFLPNPLLPDTRAELVTPMMIGNQVLGVMDIQSDQINFFTETDINIQTTLASQVAAAIQNVDQHTQAKTALDELTRFQQVIVREGWESFMTAKDNPLQGYHYDLQNLKPIKRNGASNEKDDTADADSDQTATVVDSLKDNTAVLSPLSVRGATIGTLGVRDPSGQPVPVDKQLLLASISQQVAEALERARLFEETEIARSQIEERASELATINAVTEVASSQLNLTGLIEQVGPLLLETFDTKTAYIALYNRESKLITFPYYHSYENGRVNRPARKIDENSGFTGRIIKEHQPILFIPDADSFVEEAAALGGELTGSGPELPTSYLGVPIIVGDAVIGVIGLNTHDQAHLFDESDQRLLMTLAGTIGVAIQNAQQFETTQRRAERERIVNEITQKIQSTLSVENALQTAVQELGQALKAKNAQVELAIDGKSKASSKNGS